MTGTHLTVGLAFVAGLISFISPCVLPLVPAYLSLLTGTRLEELREDDAAATRIRTLGHALAFVAGFTIVFVLLGASAGEFGSLLREYQVWIARVGGVLVIVLGLQMLGVVRIPFLMMDTRTHVRGRERTFFTSGLVGIAFAAGWSPCIGPVLAGILALASQQHDVLGAAGLLFVYSIGLAVPFILTAAGIGVVLPLLDKLKRWMRVIERVAGVFMIGVGIVLATNSFLVIAGWFYQFVPAPTL